MITTDDFIGHVRSGINAPRNNSAKWNPLYKWFRDELGIGDGKVGTVVAKVIVDPRQVGNRVDEMAGKFPNYAVISVIGEVTIEKTLLRIFEQPALASLKAVLFLQNDVPDRVVVFE